MRHLRKVLQLGGIALAVSLFASAAFAFDDGPAGPFAGAQSVPQEVLASERAKGFEDIFGPVNVTDNTLSGTGGAGTNLIDNGSFGSANCLCTVMQNTGNGAVMQHATIIQLGPVALPSVAP